MPFHKFSAIILSVREISGQLEPVMKQKKRTIRLFIFIFLFLLGVCFETVRANSLFVYAASVSGQESPIDCGSAITPAGQSLPIPMYVSEGSAGHREAAIGLKRRSEQMRLRLSRSVLSCFGIAGVSLPKISSASSWAAREISRNIPSHMVIISYIHLKDGQKS